MALLLFLLAKAALVSLPTAQFVALRPPFMVQQAQFVLSFSTEACTLSLSREWRINMANKTKQTILQPLHWSWQNKKIWHFSSLHSKCSVLDTLSSPPFLLLSKTLWQKLFFLSSCTIRLQWVPKHSFS